MNVRGEWNRFDFSGVDPEAVNFAALRNDDGFSISRPRVSGEHAPNAPRLGGVHFDRIHCDALGAGLQIAEPERGAWTKFVSLIRKSPVRNPASEREPPAIGRNFRTDCAAV